MPADLRARVEFMPVAEHLGLVLDEACPDRVVAGWPGPRTCALGVASCTAES